MKYELINTVNENYTTLEQIFTNRGIKVEDIASYINTTDDDIIDYKLLGEKKLQNAASMIGNCIIDKKDIVVIVDCDVDGYTSAALIINYLNDVSPTYVAEHVTWFMHKGKEHGLSDFDYDSIDENLGLVLVPDAGSNDIEYHKKLYNKGIGCICLDHHEVEFDEVKSNDYLYAIVINNQLNNYPNPDNSGVYVTWQFCRYLDFLAKTDYANKYYDLVAFGAQSDMMSLKSKETKHLIQKGFEEENIRNPFINGMAEKNAYSLGDHITPMGCSFYITPFVNATTRSGTQEEKNLIFKSMLTSKAFEKIPSTKRGHKLGETETVVTQAVRTVTNIKNRQGKAVDAGIAFLEHLIEEENMLEDKALIFLLNPSDVKAEIRGLIGNKFMAKYQRPCCILTKVDKDGVVSYQGSARGYDKGGITNFKGVCADSGQTMYTAGHPGAFGVGVELSKVAAFKESLNTALADTDSEPKYLVDFIYDEFNFPEPNDLIAIAELENYWGKDFDEPLVAFKNLKITPNMVTVYAKKTNTIKITLNNGISIMNFNASDEECEKLQKNKNGFVEIDLVGRANKNVWNGNVSAQIMVEDYEITKEAAFIF